MAVVLVAMYSATSHAGGEHQRRFAVELAIVAGDSRLLTNTSLAGKKRRWIEQRVLAGINILPLLARYFQQETGKKTLKLDENLKQLIQFKDQPNQLYPRVLKLSHQYPVKFPLKVPQKLDALSLKRTSKLYRNLCLGCHLGDAMDNSVVVGDFASFAASMDEREWLARLIGGLHGDAYTGLENPFSDTQVALFFSYIRFYLSD